MLVKSVSSHCNNDQMLWIIEPNYSKPSNINHVSHAISSITPKIATTASQFGLEVSIEFRFTLNPIWRPQTISQDSREERRKEIRSQWTHKRATSIGADIVTWLIVVIVDWRGQLLDHVTQLRSAAGRRCVADITATSVHRGMFGQVNDKEGGALTPATTSHQFLYYLRAVTSRWIIRVVLRVTVRVASVRIMTSPS